MIGVLAAFWLALRRPEAPRLGETLGEIDGRLAGLDERITTVLKHRAEPDSPLGWAIVETLDLGEVLQRTLAAAEALDGVDGSRVCVPVGDGPPAIETRGLVAGGSTPIGGPPDGATYVHGIVTWQTTSSDGLCSGLVVPLGAGSLSVYSRTADAFDDEAAATLAAIARRAEPAVRNALKHLEVIERAATDLLTGLGSASAFAEALPRAISAARRTRRPLCLIQIDLDDFGTINRRFGQATGDATLAEFGRRVLATIRGSDAAFRNSGGADEFFLILPETSRDDARRSYARLAFEMRAPGFVHEEPVTMSSGLVELRPDDTAEALLRRADELVRIAKRSGKDTLRTDDDDV